MDTSLKACKACGEIGHLTKECPDEWPHCDDYPTEVTCFLCEGNNHVPVQCQLYPMVLQVSQQAKEGMLSTLKKTLGKPRKEKDLSHITCFKCKNGGHYANHCPQRKLQPKAKLGVVISQKHGPARKISKKMDMFPRYDHEGNRNIDRKSTRLNSSHITRSRMPSSA